MADDDTTTRRTALTLRASAGAAPRRWRSVVAAAAIAAMSLGVVSTASAAKRAAPVNLQIESGLGSLSASWAVTRTRGLAGFSVRWRLLTAPASAWGQPVLLAAKARSYVIAGLGPAAYEVRVFSIVAASRASRVRHRKKRTRTSGGSTSAAAMALGTGEEPPILEPPRDQATRESERAKERPPALGVGKAEHPKEKAVEPPRTKAGEPPAKKPPTKEPPTKEPPAKEPPAKEPPAKEPPAKEPPAKEPPAKEPPVEEGAGGAGCALYGSPSGNDANAGTQAAPVRTVPALLAKLAAGQTGCLASGAYEAFTTRAGDSHGGPGAPLTITSTNPQAPATISGRVVTMPGADYLTFSHLHFTDAGTDGPSVTIGSAHTTWTDDDVTAPQTICFETTGGGAWGPAEDTLIERDRVHNCGRPFQCAEDSVPCNLPPTNGYFIHGLYDMGIRTTARNSYFYENGSKGVLLRGGSGAVIEHNVIDGNGSGVLFGDLAPAGDTVRWNIITNSRGVCGGCNLYFGIWTFGSLGAGNSAVHNDIFGNASGNVGSQSGLTLAENIEVDPKFVDPANHDYTLKLDSPVLGYGPA
jgi:Disaggregatase related